MPVFISYSHEDKVFVDKLAAYLVKAKAHVWVDRWELHVGDSIISKIQDAIQQSSALIVVLSKASVASEWCKKELNAGLIRELEEKRVVVLPVLLEDCEVPLFLREKMYADFKASFDEGLKQVLEAIAKVTSDTLGREQGPDWHIDWAIDWFEVDDSFCLRLTSVEQAEDKPYTVYSELTIVANEVATSRYRQYERAGLEHVGRQVLLEMLRGSDVFTDYQVWITDNFPQTRVMEAHDPKTGAGLLVEIVCRRLGEDTGRNVVFNLGRQVSGIITQNGLNLRTLAKDEMEKVNIIRSSPWIGGSA